MKALLSALLFATASAQAAGPQSFIVRAEVWEVPNPTWAKAQDTMKSPDAWRQSLLLDPDSRMAGAWVATVHDSLAVESGRERTYPVEYPSEVSLSNPPHQISQAPPQPIHTQFDLFKTWLQTRSFKDFEVRDEGWRFSLRVGETEGGRCLLKIELTESLLREFIPFSRNPLVVPMPEFSSFSMNIIRSVEPGKWEIFAAQAAPQLPDGSRSGNQRVLLVHCIRG
ncbi:MAG: hypothetical protein MUF31_08495 [Akkermansiaceae bacterium]|jgi:hypothetical protein|nr:hypothetical protein [Akkermansiaceae bacterium]